MAINMHIDLDILIEYNMSENEKHTQDVDLGTWTKQERYKRSQVSL